MQKVVICNITMQEHPIPLGYTGEDLSIPDANASVVYPIADFMPHVVAQEDDLIVILLCKCDPAQFWKQNLQLFKSEFESTCIGKVRSIHYTAIQIPFSVDTNAHGNIIREIVSAIPTDASIYTDITYGSKDMPLLLFAVLSFAMQHLNGRVEKILYRRVYFVDKHPNNPVLCDYSALLNLTSLIYTISCDSNDKARKMLDALLST
jgi:hypothetical protein